jgi:glycosyltransferase involved in cell wall biosynthesis
MKRENKPKRIGIDARFYGPIGKGLGRYQQEIVDNIISIDKENEYIIFLGKENYKEFKTDNPRVKKVLTDIRWYTLREQIILPYYIWRERLDLIHFPHFNVPFFSFTKFVVTIHDLILIRYPTPRATTLGPALYKIKNIGYRLVIRSALKRAKKIIAVSKYTKEDIKGVFGVRDDKITVTYEGVANLSKNREDLFSSQADEGKTLSKHKIKNPFLLYVGNAYPHKNLEGLLRVFKKIRPEDKYKNLQLVLVGKDDYFYTRVRKYAEELKLWQAGKDNNSVVFPGFVSDQDLEILFKLARAYIFPSFYEGFGLPPLEAMAKGCPVISSERTSLPEILGEAAIYFDPDNEEDMSEKIKQVLSEESLRKNMISSGYEQVKQYSWWECARKTKDVYLTVLNK